MKRSAQFEAALNIVKELRASGHEAYLAGGCVRDLLLGRNPVDYDVATSATPDVVLEMFPRTFAVGAHFGVVLVSTEVEKTGCEEGSEEPRCVTEVATFRNDGAYSDGRHPDAVRYTTSAAEDVQRRDFTINGLLLDPLKLEEATAGPSTSSLRSFAQDDSALGERVLSDGGSGEDGAAGEGPNADPSTSSLRSVAQDDSALLDSKEDGVDIQAGQGLRAAVLDFVGGLADLEAGIVRAIGEPRRRFEEDQLRLLRAVRFTARFGFALESHTVDAIRGLAARIHAVSRERVRDELSKMLTEGQARRAFELLDETGLLAQVLPEVAKMKGVAQPPQFHPEGDVWIHTLMLLQQLPAGSRLTLAWGALLHDVGKPPTYRVAPDRIRFDGHVEVGVAMGAEICRRFRFSNDETRQILALIENHMRFADAPRMKASTLKRFFRLDCFEEHLALHRMDCRAAHGNLDIWEFVRERFHATPAEEMRPKPLLTGRELIAAGYSPGPRFKQMLQAVEDAQLEGAITSPEEAMRLVQARFPATS